jgi:hypothetical protein
MLPNDLQAHLAKKSAKAEAKAVKVKAKPRIKRTRTGKNKVDKDFDAAVAELEPIRTKELASQGLAKLPRGTKRDPVTTKIVNRAKAKLLYELRDEVGAKAMRVLANINPELIACATPSQQGVIFGILADKLVATDRRIQEQEAAMEAAKAPDLSQLPTTSPDLTRAIIREIHLIGPSRFGLKDARITDIINQVKEITGHTTGQAIEVDPADVRTIDDLYN